MTSLKEGDKAPFFKGINQDGKEITSEDFKGKKFIRRITLPDVRPKLAA